jgi:hypothetical protein
MWDMKKILTTMIIALSFSASLAQPPANAEKELAVVKQYAEQYQPATNEITYDLEVPPPRVVEALNFLRKTRTRDHEPYILLMLLKLYNNHYEHAHQSYELRESDTRTVRNPILKEYCRLAGIHPLFWEFLPSGHVVSWIKMHPKVLEYHALASEMQRTEGLIADWGAHH